MGDFPIYKDGDVKIVISGARQYQLHSGVLKSNSRMMRRLLDEEYTAKLSKAAVRKGVVVRNRLVAMDNPQLTPRDGAIKLVLAVERLDSEGRVTDGRPVGLDLENGLVVPAIFAAYDAVLGLFYHRPIDFGPFAGTGLPDILQMSSDCLEVAEYLEVVNMITKPIEATLLGTGQTLYRSIATAPAVWLDFALRIKSKFIYREAMIHAVGQYNTNNMATAMTQLDPRAAAIVNKKAGRLSDAVKDAMMRVMSFFPAQMLRSNVHNLANIDHFGRNSYSNDILSWMAITFFRQYIAQHVAGDQSHNAEDMGFALIKAIGEGGDGYLDKTTLEEFHQFFPMSNRAKAVVENKINEIKESVKVFTTTLLSNRAHLETTNHAHGFFTCLNVEALEYPWETESIAAGESDDESEMSHET